MRNMSTIIFSEKLTLINPKDNSLFAMDSKRSESLADYVRRTRMDQGFSLTDVQRQSGNQITDAYVSRIENGYIENVSPKKLSALAKGLKVAEDEVFAVARGVNAKAGIEEMRISFFGGGAGLTEEDWQEIMSVARSLIEQKAKRRKK